DRRRSSGARPMTALVREGTLAVGKVLCHAGMNSRGACAPRPKSKDDLEELNAVPFSGVIRIERRALDPCAVTRRRRRIQHLERVATRLKCPRSDSLDGGSS